MSDFIDCLKDCGLPDNYGLEDFHIKENRKSKSVTIHDLCPKISIEIIKNLQGKTFHGRKMTAYTLVEDTPQKKIPPTKKNSANESPSEKSDSDSTDDEYDTSYEHNDNSNGYIFKAIDSFKRKAELSPASEPVVQSKKERKRLKKLNK